MIHTEDPDCPGCEKKLVEANPELTAWFKTKVKPTYPLIHVAIAWRDETDQELAFLQGKSKVHWPDSKHNAMQDGKPCSLALDLFLQTPDGFPRWPIDIFHAIADNSPEIRWGGTFTTLKDYDHFELKGE